MYTFNTDFLIIGGGIIGTSAAYILSKLGKSVILVEKESIAAGSTGMSAGTIFCAGKGKIPELNQTMKTRELLLELKLQGYDCGWRPTGALQIATSVSEKNHLREKFKHWINNGHNHLEFLNTQQVQALEPRLNQNVLAAIHSPLSGHVDPNLTARAFADAALDHGATLIENAEATQIKQIGDKYKTTFNHNLEITSKSIILATGVSSHLLKYFKDHLVPKITAVKGQIWKTDNHNQKPLNKVIFTCGSHLFWSQCQTTPPNCTHQEGKQLVDHAYGKQTIDGSIIFGGDRIPSNDFSEDLTSLERNQKYVSQFLPNLKPDQYWTGLMPFSSTGKSICKLINPILYPNVWFVGGFGPHGIMEGPGCVNETFNQS